MSGYPHTGLFSARRKQVVQTPSRLYASRRTQHKQNENEVDHSMSSSLFPTDSSTLGRPPLINVANTRRRSKSKNTKSEAVLPPVERKGPHGSQSSRAEIISDIFNDSETSSPEKAKTPWSYFGYAEPEQLAKVRGEVLARVVQPIDKPLKRQELEDPFLPRRAKKAVQFEIDAEKETQPGAEEEEGEVEDVGEVYGQHLVTPRMRQVIERWLEYSLGTWDEAEEPGPTEKCSSRKLTITSLDHRPIRRLNFVTAASVTVNQSSPTVPLRTTVTFKSKANIIGLGDLGKDRELWIHSRNSAVDQAKDHARAFHNVVPDLEHIEQQLAMWGTKRGSRRGMISRRPEKIDVTEIHGELSAVKWDYEWEWKSYHRRKALKELEAEGDVLSELSRSSVKSRNLGVCSEAFLVSRMAILGL